MGSKDKINEEFLQEQLARTRAEAESFRMQADAALKWSEQVWWSWNLRRRRLKIRAVEDCILGYPEEDMEHGEQFWWDRMHPEDRAEVEESLIDCFDGKTETWRCEHRLRDTAGDWVWVEQSGFVLERDADGSPVEMVGTTRKTQERYQLLELFHGSEALIAALIDEAPFHFWIRDQTGKTLVCSKSLQKALGSAHPVSSVSELADSESYAEWQTAFESALRGEPVQSEISLKINEESPARFGIHLIPVPVRENPPFAVLEIFIPKAD